MKYEAYSDEELIVKLREGDGDIADYLIEKYKPLVRKKTNAMYLIGGENEDLIQEGMIGLFKAIRNYNEEKGCNFFSFAELCIGSQLYSALESSNRKKHQPLNTYISFSATEGENGMTLEELLTGYGINPEQMMLEAERQREFAAKLEEKLSPMEKKVLKLYLDGNSYIKIGELLGKPAKSIDNTLQRIRSKIRALEENS